MDPSRARTYLPSYWNGVRKNHVGVQKAFTLSGFDTETFFGRCFALGFVFPDGRTVFSWGLFRDHLRFLLACIFSLPGHGHSTTVVGAHNLRFDLGVLLWEILNPLGTTKLSKAPRRSYFTLFSSDYLKLTGKKRAVHLVFEREKCVEIEVFWGKPCFARFRSKGRMVHLIDTFAFFSTSLKKALKMIGAEVQKRKKPKDLGKRLIPLKELIPYLTSDCRGLLSLLKEIENLHEKYQARLCVSLPQLSSRIFRHHYLHSDCALPPRALLAGALLSYHGGKNTFIGKSGWYKNAWDLDINSAYPEAMAQLPDFENGKWILGSGMRFFRRQRHGIFKVRGFLRACAWGSLFTHDFKKASGEIEIWTTGYEIKEALDSGHLEIYSIRGYGFQENFHAKNPNAFARFVHDFYKLKSEAKGKVAKYFYKLILNALYGKFIQRTQDDDGNWVAGSMFDPAIASLITGYVRARLHGLEHRYKAIHTATDGFITQTRPRRSDLGNGLGKLKTETFGPVLILRNKLYLHFDLHGKLKKSGLHGFEGDAKMLEKMWRSSKRIYTIKRLVKWSEAWHCGVRPGAEITVKKKLGV